MKKMISIILTAILMVMISACGNAIGVEQASAAGKPTLHATSLSSGASAFTKEELR